MIFEFPKAPMHYEQGIPAYKAGEWEGIKPCKFMPTRKMIRPISYGIIFTENENILPKKRVYSQGPSKEYEFKPSIKMVDTSMMNQPKKERGEKLHYFKYREDASHEIQDRQKNLTNKLALDQELRLLKLIGFKKKEEITNFELLNSLKKKDNFFNKPNTAAHNSLVRPDDMFAPENKTQREKIAKDNLLNDTEYVKTLKNWDKKFLPKIENNNNKII